MTETASRVYEWSYVESGSVIVTEADAREWMDPDETELVEEHWKRAARYLTPEGLEGCLHLDEWRPPRDGAAS